MATPRSSMEIADEIEELQLQKLGDIYVQKSLLYNLADGAQTLGTRVPGSRVLMGEDPRLAPMPAKPTLMDFFRYRFAPTQAHLLQSARLARNNGLPEKLVLACLLHDVAVVGFIRADHGYWGAQLVEPYVDEEISWAIRAHQVLRFFPDEDSGYTYPEAYRQMFGEDYQPEPYVREAYDAARKHKWYMSARMICVNDLYAFDPTVEVALEEFEDIIGRHFKQPAEGLGNDHTSASHMWRTLRRPCNAL